MKKSALFCAIVLSAVSFTVSAARADEFQGIRMLQTSTQLLEAVQAEKVVVGLSKNMFLQRKKGHALAVKKFENISPLRDYHGRTIGKIVTHCELSKPTRSRYLKLDSTQGLASPWLVRQIDPTGGSEERWSLTLNNPKTGRFESLNLDCRAYMEQDHKVSNVSLTANMVNNALRNVGGAVMTSVNPAVMTLQGQDLNTDLVSPSNISQ